jgi:hypothetical protein
MLTMSAMGCKPKVSRGQCDAMIERYAQLVVTERFPDASAEMIKTEQVRERDEARGDDNFKNCTSEVSAVEYERRRRTRSRSVSSRAPLARPRARG